MRLKIIGASALGALAIADSYAYAPDVHRKITENAFVQAGVTIDYRMRLGIEIAKPLAGKFPRLWSEEGSIREDDILRSFPPARSINHFLDPVHLEPLTVGKQPLCFDKFIAGGVRLDSVRADSWGLDAHPLNAWNLPKARSYQYEALMGPNPGTRNSNLTFLFRSLGHLVHLVQDMAQPEHTRNDQHLFSLGAQTPSMYEEWTLANLVTSNNLIPNADSYFQGYDTVRLPSFPDYFHSADGKGMADFANRNFVTQDTNYHDELDPSKCFRYSLPSIAGATHRFDFVTERPLDANGNPYSQVVLESVYTSRPIDLYRRTAEIDPYHTVLSAFDAETRKYDPNLSVYALNNSSYQFRAALLIPRAVGYSAGLIEHFFRGKIDATWKRTGSGPIFSHELTITNRSGQTIGADAKLSAIYRTDPSYFGRTNSDDTGTILRRADLVQLVPGFNGLADGASVTFILPGIFGLKQGDEITKFERRIAVQGTLGTEQNAVIGLVQEAPSDRGLRLEVTWDATFFVAMHILDYPFNSTDRRDTQACSTFCMNRPMVPNSTVVDERPGRLIIRVNPIPQGTTYVWNVNHAERTDRQIRAVAYLDGRIILDGFYTIPACTTVGYCHSLIRLGTLP